jgi:hypothetical protein
MTLNANGCGGGNEHTEYSYRHAFVSNDSVERVKYEYLGKASGLRARPVCILSDDRTRNGRAATPTEIDELRRLFRLFRAKYEAILNGIVSTGSNGSTIEGLKVVVETCLPFTVSRHCESPLSLCGVNVEEEKVTRHSRKPTESGHEYVLPRRFMSFLHFAI